MALFVERAGAVAHDVSLGRRRGDAGGRRDLSSRRRHPARRSSWPRRELVSMTVTEVRDRLDDRFRLLIGSRRGLERHQTLRQAVQWSLRPCWTMPERVCCNKVFGVCGRIRPGLGVRSGQDPATSFAVLDLARRAGPQVTSRQPDGSSGANPIFRCWRRFASSPRSSSSGSGAAELARNAHARYFAACEDDVLALWDSPRQREAYEWLAVELANLRTAFRWTVDRSDLDTGATIAVYAAVLGLGAIRTSPSAGQRNSSVPPVAADHRRLVQLCVMAGQCFVGGSAERRGRVHRRGDRWRSKRGRYTRSRSNTNRSLGSAYHVTGHPEKTVDDGAREHRSRGSGAQTFRARDAHRGAGQRAASSTRRWRLPKTFSGTAEAIGNPQLKAVALDGVHAGPTADADPAAAYDASAGR